MHSFVIGNIVRYGDVNLWFSETSGGIVTSVKGHFVWVKWAKGKVPAQEWAPNLQLDPRGNFRNFDWEDVPDAA